MSSHNAAPLTKSQEQSMTDEHSTQTLSARDIALLEKYKAERAKRIRADGLAQFRRTDDEFAHFLEDPYVEPLNRAPMEDEPDVVVVGGGWSGMLTALRLRQAGVDNIRIIESGSDFGGVWYWNRYPGCKCDVDSFIYIPLLEETATCRPRSMPSPRRSGRMPGPSAYSSTCIGTPSSRRA
jgi:cyclohexanone monooxygenase